MIWEQGMHKIWRGVRLEQVLVESQERTEHRKSILGVERGLC